jgi:predicted nucleotidyltransferase/HEPN domain-containing protein
MRTDLDHLPDAKRRELELIQKILFEEFEDAIQLGTQPFKRQGRILKIILFGSYARGDWVNDPVGGYISDYDLLVIVNHEKLTDTQDYWAKADDHLLREYAVTHRLTAPANFIVHSIDDVNAQLRRGRYFFTDIVKDGIELYAAPVSDLATPQPLSAEEARAEAQAYFDEWFRSAGKFLRAAEFLRTDVAPKESAFNFHQAAERLYHCTLLTLTLYSPKSHKLTFLRSQAEQLDARLADAWPRGSKFERRCFELLVRAYVDARYSPHYKIEAEELHWIGERVTALQQLVEIVCKERLSRLEQVPGE